MIAGFILTGGKNRRMGGKKKLLLEYKGKRFLDMIWESLNVFPKVYLSVEDASLWADLLADMDPFPEMVEDIVKDAGPLGGIVTGLRACEEEALFVAACDMPFFNRGHVERLLSEYEREKKITLGRCNGRVQRFPGIYPKSVLPVFEKRLESGEFRMMSAIEEAGYCCIDLDEEAFRNINSRKEYEKLSGSSEENEGVYNSSKIREVSINSSEEFKKRSGEVKSSPFIFAVSGYKNSGKTTMVTALIPELRKQGYKVAVIKHDGHDFVPDVPGTDSYRHREAGAYAVAIYSNNRYMITKECTGIGERDLMGAFPEADIILIEGLKDSNYPKYVCNYPDEQLIDAGELAKHIISLMNKEND